MNRRATLLAVLVPIVLLAGGWWALVWAPRNDEAAAAEVRSDELQSELSANLADVAAAQRFADGGRAADDRLQALRDLLPGDADLGGFIRVHDELAASTGVTVESLAPADLDGESDPSTPAGTKSSQVVLTVVGSAAAVGDYLTGMSELPRAVVIDRLDSTSTSDGMVRMNLELRIFQASNSANPFAPPEMRSHGRFRADLQADVLMAL